MKIFVYTIYITSGCAPRVYGIYIRMHMEGHKNSIKPSQDLYVAVKENHIGSAVSEILRYRPKKLTTLYNRIYSINMISPSKARS